MIVSKKRKELLHLADKHNVVVDRWDNIKYQLDTGQWVRYNFKKIVIRYEYRDQNGAWHRLRSVRIMKLDIARWGRELDQIYNYQNEVKN